MGEERGWLGKVQGKQESVPPIGGVLDSGREISCFFLRIYEWKR